MPPSILRSHYTSVFTTVGICSHSIVIQALNEFLNAPCIVSATLSGVVIVWLLARAITCRLRDFSAWWEVGHSAWIQGSPVEPSVQSPPAESGCREGNGS